MPSKPPRPPKYRLYRPKNLAVVRIDGRDHYLGPYNSPESHELYERLVAEWLLTRRSGATPGTTRAGSTQGPITVAQLVLAFWDHAKKRYVKNGRPTSEQRSFKVALRPVRQLYGSEPVTAFGPLALTACKGKLIEAGICRKRINQHLSRIRLVFKWGVARELVPESVWRALCAVEGVKYGEAPETDPVTPVAEAHINAVEPFITPQVWAMIQFQLSTGCRPGEVCVLRSIDINTAGAIWEYRPHSHKTEHHGKERVIYLGPQAQKVIKPWLKSDLYAYLFSPREARAWFQAERAKNRKTPRPRNGRVRPVKAKPKRAPGDRYEVRAYDRAIERACEKAEVPVWSPNQLRHNAATRIRSEFGIEAARIILGHSSAVTSEIYAEIDREKAQKIMGQIG